MIGSVSSHAQFVMPAPNKSRVVHSNSVEVAAEEPPTPQHVVSQIPENEPKKIHTHEDAIALIQGRLHHLCHHAGEEGKKLYHEIVGSSKKFVPWLKKTYKDLKEKGYHVDIEFHKEVVSIMNHVHAGLKDLKADFHTVVDKVKKAYKYGKKLDHAVDDVLKAEMLPVDLITAGIV